MSIPKAFFDKKILAAGLIYFLINAFLLYRFGVRTDGEAVKFIDNGTRLFNGEMFFNGVFGYFYLLYSFLVGLFIKLSIPLMGIAVLQIGGSFVAAVCLYRLLNQHLNNDRLCFLCFIIYLLCYPIQKWNFFLYSESLHTSLVVIGIYCLNNWIMTGARKHFIQLLVVLLLVLVSRPAGLVFFLALFMVLLCWLHIHKKRVQFFLFTAAGIVSMVLLLNSPFTAFVNPDSIKRMEVICQVPETNDSIPYSEYNRAGLMEAFSVIKNEVGVAKFFELGVKKLGYFFGMYRSHYSWQHNLLLLCYALLYPLALIGIFSRPARPLYYTWLFTILYLLITSAAIFFTCDEWSNRFIAPLFPSIMILAALGLHGILRKRSVVQNH